MIFSKENNYPENEKLKIEPPLIPIGERAEAIRRAFEERQLSSKQALEELEKLIHQLREAEEERKKSLLSPEAFAVGWWARVQKDIPSEKAGELACEVEPIFVKFPHWTKSKHQEGELRRELYKVLNKMGVSEIVKWADEILTFLRRVHL